MPLLFSIAGFKNSGKTTLCWKILSLLKEKGLEVAYLKHTHEKVLSLDNTDTGKRSDLCLSTGLWGSDGLVLEFGEKDLDSKTALSLAFKGKDVVLMEGGKNMGCPKIWVGSPSDIPPDVRGVLACYCSSLNENFLTFQPGEEDEVASYVYKFWKRSEGNRIELYIGNKRIPVKEFVSDFLARGLRGMLSALHGVSSFDSGIALFIKSKKNH